MYVCKLKGGGHVPQCPIDGDANELMLWIQLHSSGGSEHEVNRRISISRNCMQMLDCRHIWRSMISVSTKLRLYNVYTPSIFIWSRNVVHNQSYREEN